VFSRLSSALKNPLQRKPIRGVPITILEEWAAAVRRIAGGQRLNSA